MRDTLIDRLKAEIAALDEQLDVLPAEKWTVELQRVQDEQNVLVDCVNRLTLLERDVETARVGR